jgi:hypothetical protein
VISRWTIPRECAQLSAARDIRSDRDRIAQSRLLFSVEPVPQRLALDEEHDVEENAVSFARIEQGNDPGMVQARGDLDFSEEPLGA